MMQGSRLLCWLFAPVLFAMLIAITGCSSEQPQRQVARDIPSLSSDEACALVYHYLQSHVDGIFYPWRADMQSILNQAAPSFRAVYAGQGRWHVVALGYGYHNEKKEWLYFYAGGKWYVYEKSGIVVPGDNQARSLLEHWQTLKRTPTQQSPTAPTAPTRPAAPTPAPAPVAPRYEPQVDHSQREFYLRRAEYYQSCANTDLDMANMALDSANFQLSMGNMQMYEWALQDYQQHMKSYAENQRMANEYLIKAQREP